MLLSSQLFFIAIVGFIIAGFYRGWRREVISLLFILLGINLVNQSTSQAAITFIVRLPGRLNFLLTNTPPGAPIVDPNFFKPWGTLLIFLLVVALGYYIGNKVFPRPATPPERIIGVIPAVLSGAGVLYFLTTYFPKQGNQTVVSLQLPNPGDYVPIIFVIGIISVIVAAVSAKTKKVAKK